MFASTLVVALSLFGSYGLAANALHPSRSSVNSERSLIELADGGLQPRGLSSFSSSSESRTQISSFMSSWSALSHSFSQCQSAFSQRSSVTVVSQSVQHLYSSYQSALGHFQSCAACSSFLSQSGYKSQIEKSVTSMFSSFQSIIATGQEYYSSQWQHEFSSTFRSMSQFGRFTQQVCSLASINLGVLLGGTGLDLKLFVGLGIDLGSILGGTVGGLLGGSGGGLLGGNGLGGGVVGGLLGGGDNHGGNGLLGNLLR